MPLKKGDIFSAADVNIDSFIQYYFERYKEIGQELDLEDKKENYIS